MLFILIPLAWLTVLTVVVAACCMASRADDAQAARGEQRPAPVRNVLVVWDAPSLAFNGERCRPARRPLEHRRPLHAARPARRRARFAAHSAR